MNEGGPTTSSHQGSPTGPVFEKGRSPLLRPFLFLAGLVALGLIGFLGYRLATSDGTDSSDPEDGESSGVPEPAFRLDQVEPESVDELQPALDAVAAEHDQPLALWDLEIRADEVLVSIQVPDEPEFVDRYSWSDGELSRPAPVELPDPAAAALPDNLFRVEDVDPDVVAAILADSATQHPDDPDADVVATGIQISRAIRLPDDPELLVFVTGRDYGREDDVWSLKYDAADGTFLAG